MATIAVGDIHGNLPALESLLAKVVPGLGSADQLVFLGDYIDRGPGSRECVDRVVRLRHEASFEVITLMGNHEQWMLRSLRDPRRHSWILGMEAFETIASYSPGVARSLREEMARLGPRIVTDHVRLPYELFFDLLPESHRTFFARLQPFHRSPAVVCVHGGLDPSRGPVENQPADTIVWGGDGFPDDYRGEETIVYGHRDNFVLDADGWPRPREVNNTFGIDTISQGVLTALRFPDGELFQSERYAT